MTESEAIRDLDIIRFNPHWDELVNEEYWQELMEMAIKALEEIQQYRAIGTVEECRAAVGNDTKRVIKKHKVAAPEDIEAFGADALLGRCPVCEELVNNVWNEKYCGDCGQKLDWSDEE